MKAPWLKVIILICLSFVVFACNQTTEQVPDSTPVLVHQYTETTAFEIVYPVNWVSNIVDQGLLIFGPIEVVSLEEPGPSVTIYRIQPEKVTLSLEEHLDRFLERGPLTEEFTLSSEVSESSLGQYPALRADIQREAGEILTATKGFVISVKVANGAIYHFVATAPTEEWEQNLPLINAMIQNMTFNE
jgi:hypothetical protein